MSRFAVLGDPIAHSRSPRMHAAAYRALGLDHTYEALHVRDAELAAVVSDLRAGRLAGCNVTVPHKIRVLDHVDRQTPLARAFGAANTLVIAKDGGIVAHNTDVPALVAEIAALGPKRTAIVLGSGGAARAVIAALCTLRFEHVVVRARRPEVLESLAVPAGTKLELAPFEAGDFEPRAGLVVQATSLGLASPGDLATAAVDWTRLPSSAAALDLVYGTPATPFLVAAKQARLTTADGLGMLARQGALAFEAWLGIRAPLYTMWEAIR